MTDEIIQLKKGASLVSLKINESNFWFSSEKHPSLDSMRGKVEKNDGNFFNEHGIVRYQDIKQITLNEKSEKIVLIYANIKGKEEEIDLEFDDTFHAHKIGEFIASRTKLKKTVSTEKKIYTLVKSLLWPIGIAAATLFIAFVDLDIETDGYSRQARRKRRAVRFVNFLYDHLGQTGILIIGTLITSVFIYIALKRFKNPVKDIVYR